MRFFPLEKSDLHEAFVDISILFSLTLHEFTLPRRLFFAGEDDKKTNYLDIPSCGNRLLVNSISHMLQTYLPLQDRANVQYSSVAM